MTHLGQLPFMLFTEMAQTWAVQRDSVNTAIIHSYSTLPRNGRIHGLSKITGINIGCRTDRFCSSRQDPKAEDRTGWVRRTEADPQRADVGSPKPSSVVSVFNRTDLSLRPSDAERTGNGPPKETWSFHLRHYRLWIFSLHQISLKWRNPEWSDIERRYA